MCVHNADIVMVTQHLACNKAWEVHYFVSQAKLSLLLTWMGPVLVSVQLETPQENLRLVSWMPAFWKQKLLQGDIKDFDACG